MHLSRGISGFARRDHPKFTISVFTGALVGGLDQRTDAAVLQVLRVVLPTVPQEASLALAIERIPCGVRSTIRYICGNTDEKQLKIL